MSTTGKVKTLLEMIKFEHTIFALPFAFIGAFLAADGIPKASQCFWILLGMAGGRTAAMGFNRIVDAPFDAKNPRTADRAIPKGEVSIKEAWAMVLLAVATYFFAAYSLNPLAFKVSPFFLAVILAYSYTKRFTPLCHIFLGLAIGLAPAAGWIGVKGSMELLPAVLSSGVMFWVAGFDILYSCLDFQFDKEHGLHSIPAAVGLKKAFTISALLHAAAFACFAVVGLMAGLNFIYYLGLAATFILLFKQHTIVKPDDLSRLDMAFFTFNGAISVILFASTAASLIFHRS